MAESADVFVIGGGPAGLAAAIAARRKGFRVTLADLNAPAADKACGEGLMPETLEALRSLGMKIPVSHGRPFRGIRFLDSSLAVEASFPAGHGLGVRRTTLHQLLAEHAAACGVRLLWKTNVTGITARGVALSEGFVVSRWIVGADGGNSKVRGWSGLEPATPATPRFGFRRHYRVEPWTDRVEVHWGPRCQIVVTPVGAGEICAALLSSDAKLRLADALPLFPALAARFQSARPASQERGATCVNLRLPQVYRNHVVLLGDASGSVDAITGQGLFLGFSQAIALAEAMARGDLAHYQAAHRRLTRRPALMARLMLAMDGRPRVRCRVMRIFSEEPRLFARMLAIHVGSATAVDCAVDGLRLGWRMVTP
ncbi:MAG TPA: FAD-dependent monooxygenase [Candidatus Acidoferrales bacterium]|nr:FAD-dependent monooxygenase [Candidatus Acidoferrales bacterium]